MSISYCSRSVSGSHTSIELIESWKVIFKNEISVDSKAWILFKNGTVVLVPETQSVETATEAAKKIMEKDGPVYPGTPHGDFNVSL